MTYDDALAGDRAIRGFARLLSHLHLTHVLLIALVARLAWIALVPVRPISDALAYDQLAQRIAGGHGYSWPDGALTAYWPVGTPALYAALYRLFGHDMTILALFNVALGVVLVALTYALARTSFDHAVALLSALLTALWPTWIAFTSIISSELPSNILFVAGATCALWPKGRGWARTIAASALLTGAAYFRATMLPFAILVPVVAALAEAKPRQILMRGILGLMVCALLITLHFLTIQAPSWHL